MIVIHFELFGFDSVKLYNFMTYFRLWKDYLTKKTSFYVSGCTRTIAHMIGCWLLDDTEQEVMYDNQVRVISLRPTF